VKKSGSLNAASLTVTGDVRDVFFSRITADDVFSKRFSDSEFSFGIGALGDKVEDYFDILGEMMTFSGNMAWLPTDGHDTADFLSLGEDTGKILIRSPFNISLPSSFYEFIFLEMEKGYSVSLEDLYEVIFSRASSHPEFKGIASIASIVEFDSFSGKALKKSPVKKNSPANEKAITHPANQSEWFLIDKTARHKNVLAVLCGAGLDLRRDLSDFNENDLNRVFNLAPNEVVGKTQILVNHGAVFKNCTFPDKPFDLILEADNIVRKGAFADSRCVADSSTLTRAFIGVGIINRIESSSPAPVGGLALPSESKFEHDTLGMSRKSALNLYKKTMKH